MRLAKIVEWIDIEAPRHEVFRIITHRERRFQLSPLWGIAQVQDMTPDFPGEGSRYHVRYEVEGHETEHDAIVTDCVPDRKFAYRLEVERCSRSTWTVQESAQGTRVTYYEEFLVEEDEAEHFVRTAHQIVRNWLTNLKRYAELRGTRPRRAAKWLVERFYLRLNREQRRTVLTILALHGVAFFSFVAAAVGFGLVSLLGGWW
jgi:uncharacterized protein YndB with AHSA1/START domain